MTKELNAKDKTATFLLYTSPYGEIKVEVFFHNENIWLTQKRMAELFDVQIPTINEHLKNIFISGELDENSAIRKFLTTADDGKKYITNFYNLDAIIVPSGLKPVHSFDLYGPLLNTEALAHEKIAFFSQIAETEHITPEDAETIIGDYLALCKGELWATGERKQEIMRALYTPLDKHPELEPNYKAAFQADGLSAVREIHDAREHVLIFSSKIPKDFKKFLPEDIAEYVHLYEDVKVKPEAYCKLSEDELQFGRRLVSHTADELPELEAAIKSSIFSEGKGKLIFVKRNNSVSEETVLSAGINAYVSDLRTVGYATFVQK